MSYGAKLGGKMVGFFTLPLQTLQFVIDELIGKIIGHYSLIFVILHGKQRFLSCRFNVSRLVFS